MDEALVRIMMVNRWRGLISSTRTNEDEDEDDFDEIVALFSLKNDKKFVYLRNRKVFYKSLGLSERRLRCRNIPRRCMWPN